VVEKRVTDTVYVERIIERVVERQPAEPVKPSTQPTQPAIAPAQSATQPDQSVRIVKKPLFAFKTNLLFDAATAINVEMEIPMGRRWSVAGEWIFPWWLIKNDQIAMEGYVGTLELRSYLEQREGKQPLTGWFLGLHGGAGRYDIEWRNSGAQGRLWYGGFSGGYAHTINRKGNLRMEYSLGLGYLRTDYTEYIPLNDEDEGWNLMPSKEGTRVWVGPTRAKISLVWMLNRNSKQKGGAQ
jgi:hypothetical protein